MASLLPMKFPEEYLFQLKDSEIKKIKATIPLKKTQDLKPKKTVKNTFQRIQIKTVKTLDEAGEIGNKTRQILKATISEIEENPTKYS